MSGYLYSLKQHIPLFHSRSSESSDISTTKTQSETEYEQTNLTEFCNNTAHIFSDTSTQFSDGDPWKSFDQSQIESLLTRYLHFNNLNIDRATKHLNQTIQWRSSSCIAQKDINQINNISAGIPISVVATHHDHILMVAIAEKYSKRDVNHQLQQSAVARMFEYFLYDTSGPKASKATIIIDFTHFSMKHVDITGLKSGITIYLNYYPEIFHKILLVNYPKLLHGVFRAIAPILDSRTASRITWISDRSTLSSYLSDTVPSSKIPQWLGGKSKIDEIKLFNGAILESEDLENRFQ